MSFTKLDYGIIDSSIWDEHSDVVKVFQAFWAKSDSEGYVTATYNSMFRTANLCDRNRNPLPVDDFEFALNILLQPDSKSRTKDQEGRRIIKLEESKWFIVNYKKYRDHTYSKNADAVRKREYRKTNGTNNGTNWDKSQDVQSVLGHSISVSVSDSVLEKGCGEKPFSASKLLFDEFRKTYGGTKKGLDTEYNNFVKKTKDHKLVLPTLMQIITKYRQWREDAAKAKMFVPEWKNLQTWINNRCWEDELPVIGSSNSTNQTHYVEK